MNKIVKEHITNFERPNSEEDFKDKVFNKKYELEEYTNIIASRLYDMWPERFRKYLGITKKSLEKMIISPDYDLFINDAYDLWEKNVSIQTAVEELYIDLNKYFRASASVM